MLFQFRFTVFRKRFFFHKNYIKHWIFFSQLCNFSCIETVSPHKSERYLPTSPKDHKSEIDFKFRLVWKSKNNCSIPLAISRQASPWEARRRIPPRSFKSIYAEVPCQMHWFQYCTATNSWIGTVSKNKLKFKIINGNLKSTNQIKTIYLHAHLQTINYNVGRQEYQTGRLATTGIFSALPFWQKRLFKRWKSFLIYSVSALYFAIVPTLKNFWLLNWKFPN